MKLIIFGPELLFAEVLGTLLGHRGHDVLPCPMSSTEFINTSDIEDVEVALVDFSNASVAESVSKLKEKRHNIPVVVILQGESNPSLLQMALASGADGICLKADAVDEMERVFARVNRERGGAPIISAGARNLATRRALAPRGARLTPKEKAVLILLVRGTSTANIANALSVSEATVRTHLQHLFTKFGVHSRIALAAAAVRNGAIADDDEAMVS